MKKILYILISLNFFSCAVKTDEENHSKPLDTTKFDSLKNATSEVKDELSIDTLEMTIEEASVRKTENIERDTRIEIINFTQKELNEFFYYSYDYLVLDSSRLHQYFKNHTTWDGTYSESCTEDTGPRSVNLCLLEGKWLPLYRYKKDTVLYEPGDFHGGYIEFSDSRIIDFRWMDGPYIYQYVDRDSAEISFTDLKCELSKWELIVIDSVTIGVVDSLERGYLFAHEQSLFKRKLIVSSSNESPEGMILDKLTLKEN